MANGIMDEIKKEAEQRFIDLYAELLLERTKTPRDSAKIAEIGKELAELNAQYGFDNNVALIGNPSRTIIDEATARFNTLKTKYDQQRQEEQDKKDAEEADAKAKDQEKKDELLAKYLPLYEEQYYAYKRLQHKKDKESQKKLKSILERLTDTQNKIITECGKDANYIRTLNSQLEENYKRIFKARGKAEALSDDYDKRLSEVGDKKNHKILNYKKNGIGSKLVSDAIAVGGMIAALMTVSSVSAMLPTLPILGAAAMITGGMLSAEGQRRFLTGIRNQRLNTITVYYNNVLSKKNIKLNKIKEAAKAKFDSTGSYSVRDEKKITKLEKSISRTKHKIMKIEKKGPVRRDLVAAGLQVGLSFLLLSSGATLVPQFAVGLSLFALTTLANKIAKKK